MLTKRPPPPNAPRLESLDVLRGVAVLWMTVFHFCYDLSHFGFWSQAFLTDPLWTVQRICIVSLFLWCAGMGQAVAVAQGQRTQRFWRRWAQVAGCAVLVSVGSALMFPQSFIYFGVLHGIALMLIIVRWTSHWGAWRWLAGALAIGVAEFAWMLHQGGTLPAWLNAPGWNVLGLIGRKPVTEDYAPLLPWLGVMWWGAAAGAWLLARPTSLPGCLGSRRLAPLAWMGRHSLAWYMLHQPVLMGALALAKALTN